jgi:hypothetical protein
MYNLEALSPQEKDDLLKQLITRYDSGEQPTGDMSACEHGDQAQDLDMLKPFADVIEMLIGKVEQLEERLTYNEKLVVDDLFGGIDRLYKSNKRNQSIDGLKGKYGEMFSPHMDALKELSPDEDLYETLHDTLEQMRGGDAEWNDEKESGTVGEMAKMIGDKIAKIKGAPVAVEVEKTVTTPAVEVVEDEPVDDQTKLFNRIKEMRKKAPKSF